MTNNFQKKMLPFWLSLLIFATSCQKEVQIAPFTGDNKQTENVQVDSLQADGLVTTNFATSISKKSPFKVIGYVFAWTGNLKNIQYDKLTHINYAFILPTKTGGILPIDNVEKLIALVKIAHSKNVKVLASIGGWNYGDDSGFRSIAANSKYRSAFAATMLALIKKYNLDGVDIDWETPKMGIDDKNFSLLMAELYNTIHGNGKLFSAAVPPLNTPSIQNKIFNSVDYLNIMAYDSFYDVSNHSPYVLANLALGYWRGRGLSAEKAVLGVPFYGRARKNWDFLSYVMYNDILVKGGSPSSDSFGDTRYNGISTMVKKTKLAKSYGGGIMIWELSGDVNGSNSLLTAINQTVITK